MSMWRRITCRWKWCCRGCCSALPKRPRPRSRTAASCCRPKKVEASLGAAALSCRLYRAGESCFQYGDRQMGQQVGQAQLRGICVGKTLHRIAADIKRGVKILRTGPMSAAVGQRCKPARDHGDCGLTAAPPGERDEMVAMRPSHFERLVIAVREYVGEFGPKLEQMPCPGQLQMPARPLLDQPAPTRFLQRVEAACALGKIDRPPVVGIDQ